MCLSNDRTEQVHLPQLMGDNTVVWPFAEFSRHLFSPLGKLAGRAIYFADVFVFATTMLKIPAPFDGAATE